MIFKMANHGQLREINATDQEIEIFEIVKEMAAQEDLELCRKSDNYVTAALGDWDLARIKCTERAKWIQFPAIEAASKKHRIASTNDVRDMADLVDNSLAHIRKYSK